MALKPLSAEDFAAIVNLMGKYQHLVDDGDEEGWANLFTEDGAFLGLPGVPDGFRGHEALKQVPRLNLANGKGGFRHNMCSFSAEYGDSRDEARARYYIIGTLSTPEAGTQVVLEVDVRTHLLRIGGEWKIKSNTMAKL